MRTLADAAMTSVFFWFLLHFLFAPNTVFSTICGAPAGSSRRLGVWVDVSHQYSCRRTQTWRRLRSLGRHWLVRRRDLAGRQFTAPGSTVLVPRGILHLRERVGEGNGPREALKYTSGPVRDACGRRIRRGRATFAAET